MQINYLAVLVGAILNMVIGAVWYSPLLFAKPWMKATGKSMNSAGSPTTGYALSALCSLVVAWVLAYFIGLIDVTGFTAGMAIGFWAWLGFVVTTHAANYVFEGRSRKLYAINVGYSLVAFVLIGGLLAVWR
jgi:hypothetical protein